MNKKASLILEGGGMRGVYTAGVLEYFMEQSLYFDLNYGVSAGACNGMSYLSRQAGRNKRVMIDYVEDDRYMSVKGLLKGDGLFSRSFIFGELPMKLEPYDFDAFRNCDQDMYAVVTNCRTGNAEYLSLKEAKTNFDMLKVVLASSSLPYISRPVRIDGEVYMDGGIADSIPIREAIASDVKKHVVVLTRERGYRKEVSSKAPPLTRTLYRNYKGLVKSIVSRSQNYNESLEVVDALEKEGLAYPIYPSKPLPVTRTERGRDQLKEAYEIGYQDAKHHYPKILAFLENKE